MSSTDSIKATHNDVPAKLPFLRQVNRRLLTVLALLATIMFFRNPAALTGAAGCFLFIALWSGVPLRHMVKRLLLIVPFGLGAVVFIPFQGAGTPFMEIGPWTATQEGMDSATVILLKMVCANVLLTYLLFITPLFDLIRSLRSLGVSAIFIEIIGLMMRYFFLLKEEAASMVSAQRSRGLELRGWLWSRRTYKRFGELLGVLFLRAFHRSERIHQSISARGGFSGGGMSRHHGESIQGGGSAAIEVRDASYSYGGSNIEALRGVSFTIERGVKTVLMGPNGAGKSTLISLLNGLEEPSSGEVQVLGKRWTRESGMRLRQRVGVVYQDPDDQIFSTSVEEDVAFGPRNLGLPESEVKERVADALRTMGICELRGRSPFELSYGQKRRVAIAGVLAMRPEIIILDEPMAFLDPKSRDDLQAMLDELHGLGITLMVATHDVDFAAEWAERVLLLKEGRLLAAGTTDLLYDDALIAKADLHLPRLARPFRLLHGVKGLRPRTVQETAQLIWKLMMRGPGTSAEEDEEARKPDVRRGR
ncbi:cobalt ECF transporter T component CbiQ [Paenibacillus oenotherae]|uniref:Cobalt ECF transporter T component CbiQ n=1 Tax=Paenibacillus oenotherae TaxID=1435645 RepID=A0ABS7DBU0_9BACL|nr:cobalt ECF transporter T component CbiQ [Paenibacillus oenotherae]MBW7477404.1 cobalt ECF transporter T component CbiQ [Paenibacillus oenotherae]